MGRRCRVRPRHPKRTPRRQHQRAGHAWPVLPTPFPGPPRPGRSAAPSRPRRRRPGRMLALGLPQRPPHSCVSREGSRVTATRRYLDVSHGRLAWAGEHPPRVLAVAGYLATVVAVNWTTARFGLLPVWPGVLAPAGVFAAVTGQSGVAFYGRVANDGQAE